MKKETLHKVEKMSLKIFLTCMIVCAVAFIVMIWTQTEPEWIPLIPTLFVIGLANFLIWLPSVIYRLIEEIKK